MKLPDCPCCQAATTEADIVPDGMYVFGDQSLVSWRCTCGTNRALRFQDVGLPLRRAAMLADMARDEKSEMTAG